VVCLPLHASWEMSNFVKVIICFSTRAKYLCCMPWSAFKKEFKTHLLLIEHYQYLYIVKYFMLYLYISFLLSIFSLFLWILPSIPTNGNDVIHIQTPCNVNSLTHLTSHYDCTPLEHTKTQQSSFSVMMGTVTSKGVVWHAIVSFLSTETKLKYHNGGSY